MNTDARTKAAIEAQVVMGHCVPSAHLATDRTTIVAWSWDVDQVRHALHVPANTLWDERVLALEASGLATFTFYAAPAAHELPGWQDEPREHWGAVGIHAEGVLRLAALYGRPYVTLEESPALLAHWQLVQAEADARLHTRPDAAQWAREWPEHARCWQARVDDLNRKGWPDA